MTQRTIRPPKVGDIVRLTTSSGSGRLSDFYKRVDLPEGTLCRVVGRTSSGGVWDHYWDARPLRFVKARSGWEERPLSVSLIDYDSPHPHGWGAEWEFAEIPE